MDESYLQLSAEQTKGIVELGKLDQELRNLRLKALLCRCRPRARKTAPLAAPPPVDAVSSTLDTTDAGLLSKPATTPSPPSAGTDTSSTAVPSPGVQSDMGPNPLAPLPTIAPTAANAEASLRTARRLSLAKAEIARLKQIIKNQQETIKSLKNDVEPGNSRLAREESDAESESAPIDA